MLTLTDPTLLKSACLVDGLWKDPGGDSIDVRNPATQELVGRVPCAGALLTQRAVAAAESAGHAWRKRTAAKRAAILHRWYELVLANSDDLARLMTAEQGKPFKEAIGEIAYAASYIEWYAQEACRLNGEVLQSPWPDCRLLVIREAVGVCAAITPWNFPAAMVTRKVAPALAAGCTVVLKPASQTPLTALALAELAQRAGLPSGALNIVTGSASEIGAELTSNPTVRKLSFTGSTEIGRILAAQSAATLKKLSLELGGNAPFIVFDDSDLDAAVAGAIASKFRNSGQTCVCTNRLLVQRGIHDRFVQALAAAVKALKVGNGMESGVDQGPLIDQSSVEKVDALVADAARSGAHVVCGGRRHPLRGTFYEPTVIAGVTPTMRIAQEEVFGPVAPVFIFDTAEEALRMANDTEFGLAAYVYTRDLGLAFRTSEELEYGMVGVNTGIISTAAAPFGGIKQSGYGREGARHGIEEYTHLKYMCLDLGTAT